MENESEELKPFDYTWIEKDLWELLQAVGEQVKREVPAQVGSEPGLSTCLLVWFRLSRHTFDALVTLCANKPGEGELPRPEYVFVVPSLNRTLADVVISVVFLLENANQRWPWFMKSGWRQSMENIAHLEADLGTVPAVKEWLNGAKWIVAKGPEILGLSQEETENAKRVQRWPSPGMMINYGKDRPVRRFLRRLDDVFYVDLSQQAHVSYLGVMRRGHLLTEDAASDERRERFKGYASDQVFTAITLVLALCSVLNERFALGRDSKIQYLWSLVGEHWKPAKLLLETRSGNRLFAGTHPTAREIHGEPPPGPPDYR